MAKLVSKSNPVPKLPNVGNINKPNIGDPQGTISAENPRLPTMENPPPPPQDKS